MFQTNPQTNRTETFEFAGTGLIYSYTVVQDPPEGYQEQSPYILALVRLDEGPIVTAQLTDIDSAISIGDRVEMVTRKLTAEGKQGTIVYGYKFRPTLSA
jgi:hypothetical protein